MKVSIKRPTAGTVPRKLEQVNLCCVVSAANHERLSVVSQDRAPRSIGCLSDQAMPAAPFWELESLILQGFQRELALDILAARRSGAARRERPAPRHYRSPAPVPAMASHELIATAETY